MVAVKEEISRLARKEIRSETSSLKKASAQYRRDIAQLKRQISKLQSKVAVVEKQTLRHVSSRVSEAEAGGVRFTAKGLRSQRKRLGLSAADYGKLIGVGAQTVYNWESEISRPRKQHLPAIAAIRAMGKREVQARLEQMAKGAR